MNFRLAVEPKYVGHLSLVPGYVILLRHMPNRFHQFMMGLAFGWKFEKYEVLK